MAQAVGAQSVGIITGSFETIFDNSGDRRLCQSFAPASVANAGKQGCGFLFASPSGQIFVNGAENFRGQLLACIFFIMPLALDIKHLIAAHCFNISNVGTLHFDNSQACCDR